MENFLQDKKSPFYRKVRIYNAQRKKQENQKPNAVKDSETTMTQLIDERLVFKSIGLFMGETELLVCDQSEIIKKIVM